MSEAKELFNKFKSRPKGTNAGFIMEDGGDLEVIDPSAMRSMNPAKLKQRMSKKGVAGTFYKGGKGPVFSVMAGKMGAKADQPWVQQSLRRHLGISTLEVETDGAADLDPEPTTTVSDTEDSSTVSIEVLGGLDTLDELNQLGDLEALPEDLSGLLDVLEMPDSEAFEQHKSKVEPLLELVGSLADRLTALQSRAASEVKKAFDTWTERLKEAVELAKSDATTANGKLAEIKGGLGNARDKAQEAIKSRVEELKDAAGKAVEALKSDKRSAWLGSDLSKIEGELTTADSKLEADPAAAFVIWNGLPGRCATAIEDCQAYKDFLAKKKSVTTELYKLEDHVHKEHVRAEITQAETLLFDAEDKANEGKASEADVKLEAVKTKTTDAKGFLEDFGDYRTVRAPVYESASVVDASIDTPEYVQKVLDADTLAAPGTRDYVQATQKVQQVGVLMSNTLTSWYITDNATPLSNLKSHAAASYVKTETDEIDTLTTQVGNDITARRYLHAMVKGREIDSLLTAGKRLADRRKIFNDKRVTASIAIEDTAKNKHTIGQSFSLGKVLEKADNLASREVMRIEQGAVILDDIIRTAKDLEKVATDAGIYWPLLKNAQQRLETLRKHKRVAVAEELLKAADEQIVASLTAAGVPRIKTDDEIAPIHEDWESQDYALATATIKRAKAELDAAESLLSSIEESAAIQDEAKTADAPEKVKELVEKLRKRHEEVSKHTHAKLVETELIHVSDSCDEAISQLDVSLEIALVPLKGAAEKMVEAETVVALHTQFLAEHKVEADRRDALNLRASATRNKTKIDEVTRWLDKATEQAGERSYPLASKSVRQAAVAAEEAEAYAGHRESFEARRGAAPPSPSALWAKVDGMTDGDHKTTAIDHMRKSDEAADAFEFVKARKHLDEAESKVKLEKLTASGDMGEIRTLTDDLLKLDGGKEAVDQYLQDFKYDDGSFFAFAEIAKKRFNITLESDNGEKVATAKRMMKMLAKCPELDVRDNPSLKVVRREEPNKQGGYYQASKDLVVMNGRASVGSDQKFGANLKNSAGVYELGEVDDVCKPKDETAVRYFDWATLHEVGHAVDDRLGFMSAREGDSKFGGWKSFAGGFDALARTLAATVASGDEDRFLPYATALLNKRDVSDIARPDDYKGDWDANCKAAQDWFKIATNEKLWWSEGDSQKCKLSDGYIYQEAYKGTWVGYLADARKRGLTGYQFRAPGEWFAELYAAYHSDKLKPGHPSRNWLAAL